MALYAVEELDDALDVTRSFLTPIDPRTWLKLALVVFFVGGVGANVGGVNFQMPVGEEVPIPGDGALPDLGADVVLLVAGLVAIFLLVALAFLLVGSIMEFVLVESLRTEEVTIRRYWSRRWRQGVRLFGFRLVLGLAVLTGVLVMLAPILVPVTAGTDPSPDLGGAAIGLFLVLIPLFILFALVLALVQTFTTMFVVPIMVLEDRGVLAGWRRLWPSLRAEWVQYLGYAVAQFVLTIAAGIVVGILAAIAALLLLIPFGIVGLVGGALLAVSTILGVAVIGVVALLYALTMLAVVAIVQVPVQSYLRYYAMLVLGDVDETLDLIPTQRAAARGDASTTA